MAFSIGLVINFIINNWKAKRTDYSDHYERLAQNQRERLEKQRPTERSCECWQTETFWEFLEPIAQKANGSFFNFISLLKDRCIRREKTFIIELDNTFISLIKPHANQPNQNIAKRLFPQDEWYFLTYMTFLMSKGEQRFNWLATYPHDLFKDSIVLDADLSISGVCGHSWFKQHDELIPHQNCITLPEHALWNDKKFLSEQPEMFAALQRLID